MFFSNKKLIMQEEYPDKINMDDLYEQRKKTEEIKIQVYNKILNRVHKKIKTISRSRNGEKFCFYVLPEFVLGIPKYDIGICTSYIIDKLSDNGFLVKYTHPNLLFISWQHYVPRYQRNNIKKLTGHTVNQFGQIIKNGDKKNQQQNLNALLLNGKKNEKIEIKKKDNTQYKDIKKYKPTGNLIYDNSIIKRIDNALDKKN